MPDWLLKNQVSSFIHSEVIRGLKMNCFEISIVRPCRFVARLGLGIPLPPDIRISISSMHNKIVNTGYQYQIL